MRHDQDFHLFQLIRLLESAMGDRAKIGGLPTRGSPDGEELIRLRPNLSFQSPTRDVESLGVLPATDGRDDRIQIEVNFGGLYGSDSPLPAYFTEYLLRELPEERRPGSRADEDDREAVRDFLDVFHHRLYSLLYRGWCKYRYHASISEAPVEGMGELALQDPLSDEAGLDSISRLLMTLAGFGTRGTSVLGGVVPGTHLLPLARYGGLTTQRPRSAAAIRAVLQASFPGMPLRICQFVPRAVLLDEDQLLRLGVGAKRLGQDSICGRSVVDGSSLVRIVAGPLVWDRFRSFFPGTPVRQEFDELIRRILPREIDFEIGLVLHADEVPPLELRREGFGYLGRSSWVRSAPMAHDPMVRFKAQRSVSNLSSLPRAS